MGLSGSPSSKDSPRTVSSQAGGEVLRHGEAVLTDLAYLDRGVGLRRGEPLEHERRLLDRWFDEQITSAGQ